MRQGAWTTERLVPAAEARGEDTGPGGRRATRVFWEEERTPLVPRGVGALLDCAWEIFTRRFLGVLGVALAITLPARAVLIAMRYSGVGLDKQALVEFAVGLAQPLLIAVLVAHYVRDHVLEGGGSAWGSVRSTLRRFLRLLPVLVLLVLAQGCLVPVLACCFPIMLYVHWQVSLMPAVYAIEERPARQLVPRTLALVRGWPAYGRWLGSFTVQLIALFGLSASIGALEHPSLRPVVLEATGLDELTLDLAGAAPIALFNAIASAYLAILVTVYYFDLRVRREGLDLHRGLDALEAEHAVTEPAEAESGGTA